MTNLQPKFVSGQQVWFVRRKCVAEISAGYMLGRYGLHEAAPVTVVALSRDCDRYFPFAYECDGAGVAQIDKPYLFESAAEAREAVETWNDELTRNRHGFVYEQTVWCVCRESIGSTNRRPGWYIAERAEFSEVDRWDKDSYAVHTDSLGAMGWVVNADDVFGSSEEAAQAVEVRNRELRHFRPGNPSGQAEPLFRIGQPVWFLVKECVNQDTLPLFKTKESVVDSLIGREMPWSEGHSYFVDGEALAENELFDSGAEARSAAGRENAKLKRAEARRLRKFKFRPGQTVWRIAQRILWTDDERCSIGEYCLNELTICTAEESNEWGEEGKFYRSTSDFYHREEELIGCHNEAELEVARLSGAVC